MRSCQRKPPSGRRKWVVEFFTVQSAISAQVRPLLTYLWDSFSPSGAEQSQESLDKKDRQDASVEEGVASSGKQGCTICDKKYSLPPKKYKIALDI